MTITISLLHPSDWQTYKAIRLDALKEDPKAFGSSYEKEVAFTLEQWKERPSNPKSYIFIAKDDDSLIGMVAFLLKDEDTVAHVWGMFVKKEYRGQGIGKKLMQQFIEKAKSITTITKITLDVNPEQQSAIILYKVMGFVKNGELHHLMGDGEIHNLYSMELVLP